MKKKIDNLLLNVLLIIVLAFFAVVPMRNIQLRRLVVAAGSAALYLIVIRTMLRGISTRLCAGMLALIISVYIGFMTGEQKDYVNLAYAFLNFLTLVYLIGSGKCCIAMDESNNRAISRFAVGSAVLVSVASFLPSAYVFESGKRTGSLALGMTNPNFTGMMLFFIYSLLLVQFRRNRKNRLIPFLMLFLFYLLYLTKARACLVCAALVTVYGIFLYRIRIPQFAVALSFLIPICTVPVYLYLYSTKLRYVRFLGKALFTGRQEIYLEAIGGIPNTWHWLFGDPGRFCFANAHNAPLAIVCSCGLFGAIIVFYLFYKSISALNKNAEGPDQRVAVACLLAMLIQTSAEALVLVGYFSSTAFILIYTMMASDKGVQTHEESPVPDELRIPVSR